ncbi:MAG TPA: hypothetical protein VMU60_03410, partial [Syntrophobacteria bacterium]|nr:hypothetical protein [Syntrophobacteria bacterium]
MDGLSGSGKAIRALEAFSTGARGGRTANCQNAAATAATMRMPTRAVSISLRLTPSLALPSAFTVTLGSIRTL